MVQGFLSLAIRSLEYAKLLYFAIPTVFRTYGFILEKKKVLGNAPGLYCRGELRTEKHMRIFSYFIFFFPEILAPELSVEVFILC